MVLVFITLEELFYHEMQKEMKIDWDVAHDVKTKAKTETKYTSLF